MGEKKVVEGCKNQYTQDEIDNYFGESEDSVRGCNGCPNFQYVNGLCTCTKAQ